MYIQPKMGRCWVEVSKTKNKLINSWHMAVLQLLTYFMHQSIPKKWRCNKLKSAAITMRHVTIGENQKRPWATFLVTLLA